MTRSMVLALLKLGELRELYYSGELFESDLRYAVKQGWIDLDTAIMWTEILLDI